jgi:7-cyano-7-deazaguanine synthase
MEQIKEILFTGGYDSTFMLCKMAREESIIQPYYIKLSKKRTTSIELERINIILDLLSKKDDIKSTILPLQTYNDYEYEPDETIKRAFNTYKDEYQLGWQYLYLSQFAKTHVGIALGQERYYETPGHLTKFLTKHGHIQFDNNGVGYLPKDIDPDVYNLFGNYTYPIAKYYELLMYDKFKEWNYEDIMSNVWFCHNPKHGKPCGYCTPCKTKLKQHMFMLFPYEVLIKYKNFMQERVDYI